MAFAVGFQKACQFITCHTLTSELKQFVVVILSCFHFLKRFSDIKIQFYPIRNIVGLLDIE